MKENFFAAYDWATMMSLNPWPKKPELEYNIEKYHAILCPQKPDFLKPYIQLPLMQRLAGIGLLCGTDWTPLYKNRFYYSRLDHSIGVALIIWNFTRNKQQTLAGLFHDISTPVFSHVSDFRKGDALTQTVTEEGTESILHSDKALKELLAKDGLSADDIDNYHLFPIADNEIPQLSADRLEYMFPSGMALDGSWDLQSIKKTYEDIIVLKNEKGIDELGFKSLSIAQDYCRRFCMIGHILQLNENKLTLQLLGQIMNMAVKYGFLQEEDFMTKSEKEIMGLLDAALKEKNSKAGGYKKGGQTSRFFNLYKTFRTMEKIEHRQEPLPEEDYFNISLKVKQRYIDPLVMNSGDRPQKKGDRPEATRLSALSPKADQIIKDFLAYSDTPYGCVRVVQA